MQFFKRNQIRKQFWCKIKYKYTLKLKAQTKYSKPYGTHLCTFDKQLFVNLIAPAIIISLHRLYMYTKLEISYGIMEFKCNIMKLLTIISIGLDTQHSVS